MGTVGYHQFITHCLCHSFVLRLFLWSRVGLSHGRQSSTSFSSMGSPGGTSPTSKPAPAQVSHRTSPCSIVGLSMSCRWISASLWTSTGCRGQPALPWSPGLLLPLLHWPWCLQGCFLTHSHSALLWLQLLLCCFMPSINITASQNILSLKGPIRITKSSS